VVDIEFTQPLVELVLTATGATADADFLFVPTIAKRSGLEEADVWAVLEDGQTARRPWRRPDLDVFTLRTRPVSIRERVSLVWTYLAGRKN
jgi:hypothetical protein